MGDWLYHIKGYAEWQVICRLRARDEQARTAARTIATLYWTDLEEIV